jgi:hypothetical protein
VGVFHDQHASIPDVGNAAMRRDDLLIVEVSSVIKQHVDVSDRGKEAIPEARIALVADVDFEAGAFPSPGDRIDVDANDAGFGAQVVAPHEE